MTDGGRETSVAPDRYRGRGRRRRRGRAARADRCPMWAPLTIDAVEDRDRARRSQACLHGSQPRAMAPRRDERERCRAAGRSGTVGPARGRGVRACLRTSGHPSHHRTGAPAATASSLRISTSTSCRCSARRVGRGSEDERERSRRSAKVGNHDAGGRCRSAASGQCTRRAPARPGHGAAREARTFAVCQHRVPCSQYAAPHDGRVGHAATPTGTHRQDNRNLQEQT